MNAKPAKPDTPAEATDDLLREREQRLVAAALAEARAIDAVEPASEDTRIGGPAPDSFAGYDLVREIHRGAQGIVYQAIQRSTRRKVALKVMRHGALAGSRDRARFEQEIHLLGQLDHPNIVTVHDSGEDAGHFYYVMDYIAGRPLGADERQRDLDETLELFARICEAVNAAHLRGVIHRDLKPGNILIDDDGQPHVVDFGLAKVAAGRAAEAGPDPMTVTGQFLGSLPWASPEQAAGVPERIDMRTDVYALGVILFQMLTGEFPYEVTGPTNRVLDTIITTPARRPSTVRGGLNDEIDTIVLRCLSKERDRRYQTAGELARDVRRYLGGEPIDAKRDSGWYVLRKTLARYRLPTAFAGLFLLVGIGFGATMTIMYTGARSGAIEARAEAQEAREDAEAARAELEALRAQLKQPANWRTTFDSADRLRELPPEEGWAFIEETWGQLDTVHAKQQALKAVRFSEHPYLHRLLHLGATDPSLEVQGWAFDFIRPIAYVDAAEDYRGYLAWHGQNRDRQLDEVLQINTTAWIRALATADLDERVRLLRLVESVNMLQTPTVADVIRDEGLTPLLIEILQDPTASKDLRRLASRTLSAIPIDEQMMRDEVLPLASAKHPQAVQRIAVDLLGRSRHDWATDHLLEMLLAPEPEGAPVARLDRSNIARALGQTGDARVVPALIGVIDADNSYETVYGVGYHGLSRLTGVDYDESHTGPWWRVWWSDNRQRFAPEVQAIPIPDLPKTAAGLEFLDRQAQGEPTADELIAALVERVRTGAGPGEIFDVARSIADLEDHSVIPSLIAIIEADGEYGTVYGVGHFALGELTSVRYDESHDGAWWRAWWDRNRQRYPDEISSIDIPEAITSDAGDDAQDESDLRAGGDENKRYFLIGPRSGTDIPPPHGYKLLLVMPGGSGGADFRPFVTQIHRAALADDYVLAQLVAPTWSEEQFETIVWPTRTNPWPGMGFATEDFIGAVIDDVKQRYMIDDRCIFALSWSSSGPANYAASLAEDRRLTGSLIAMSVYWPQPLPDRIGAKGHAYYLLHSPQDFIPLSHPETALSELGAQGATVTLETYEGGHGWHGDVHGNIAAGIRWLESKTSESDGATERRSD